MRAGARGVGHVSSLRLLSVNSLLSPPSVLLLHVRCGLPSAGEGRRRRGAGLASEAWPCVTPQTCACAPRLPLPWRRRRCLRSTRCATRCRTPVMTLRLTRCAGFTCTPSIHECCLCLTPSRSIPEPRTRSSRLSPHQPLRCCSSPACRPATTLCSSSLLAGGLGSLTAPCCAASAPRATPCDPCCASRAVWRRWTGGELRSRLCLRSLSISLDLSVAAPPSDPLQSRRRFLDSGDERFASYDDVEAFLLAAGCLDGFTTRLVPLRLSPFSKLVVPAAEKSTVAATVAT